MAALACAAAPLAAQEEAGHRAWREGRYAEARTAYEEALRTQPGLAIANARLGILASWQGRLDSAIVLVRRAVDADPLVAEYRVILGRVLGWKGSFPAAIAQYDTALVLSPGLPDAMIGRAHVLSWAARYDEADAQFAAVLARDSTDVEALTGRARMAAWRGDLPEAMRRYDAVLARHPRAADAMAGRAQLYYWLGDEPRARQELARAFAADSTNRTALDLRRAMDDARRARVEPGYTWFNDSDDNQGSGTTLAASAPLGGRARAFGSVGWLHATDRVRTADRLTVEAGATLYTGPLRLTAAGGAHDIRPDDGPDRTAPTWRASAAWVPGNRVTVTLSYAHAPFDEIAALMASGLDTDLADASLDLTLGGGVSLSAGGGSFWVSDGNQRTSGALLLTKSLGRRWWIGGTARLLAWDDRSPVYFSPDQYRLYEARAGYVYADQAWGVRLGGGFGAQYIGKGADAQAAWRVEARVSRRWARINTVEAFGALVHNAATSVAGAYEWGTVGALVRVGL